MRQAQQQQQREQHRNFLLDEASSSGCSGAIAHPNHHQQQQQVPPRHQQDAFGRLDRQIQTSPSDSPAAWPPPSVHGSPRHRRALFDEATAAAGGGAGLGGLSGGDGGSRCECASGAIRVAAAVASREPTRRELYQWLMSSEPGARLFRAKYVYRPLRDSPNDNPETELSLTPGDYLLIFGDLDEDFYYRGELWTGERGLVPSNYVEPVTGGVLGGTDNNAFDGLIAPASSTTNLMMTTTGASGGVGSSSLLMIAPSNTSRLLSRAASERTSAAAGLGSGPLVNAANAVSSLRSAKSVDAFTSASDAQRQQLFLHHPASAVFTALSALTTDEFVLSDASSCPFPVVDVSNVQVQEIRPFDGARVPCPRDLLVERQLTKSVLISWSPPVNALCPVAQYHVCVDGEVRAVVPAGYKTKALIEDVDSRKVHRISVRAISDAGPSPDESCTVTLGRGSVIRPQDVKVIHVTPVSCEIAWYPSHSSCEHQVLLNGLKVGSCPAGVYRVQLRGLIPSTMYRCAIRVKDPKAVLEEKPVESYVDFKTLPKIGLPDPPSEVHCEPGPQDGTLLVTWRPVITQPKPPSRAAVAGYLVYADGRKVCEVDSPSGDHAVLRLQDLNDDPPLFITVKTKTREGAISSDSNVVRVPRTGAPLLLLLPSQAAATDTLQSLTAAARVPSSAQVAKNASTQEVLFAASSSAPAGAAPSSSTGNVISTASLGQLTATGAGATTAAEKALFSANTAPSYYVFHPRLATQQLDSNAAPNATSTSTGGVPDLLALSNQQEKPSLLEMETDYLSRHHQLQERAAAAQYQSAFSRPTTSGQQQQSGIGGGGGTSRLFLQQQQQQGMSSRQAAFSRRSYSLDEAPRGDYDPFGMIPQSGLHYQQAGAPTSVTGAAQSANAATFHPIKHHLRSAAAAITAFNGPNQRAQAQHGGSGIGGHLVDESSWNDSTLFRPSVQRLESRTMPNRGGAQGQYWPTTQQSERLMAAYGDFDTTAIPGGMAGSIYDNHQGGIGATAAGLQSLLVDTRSANKYGGVLSSRHRRRLQDAAEARTLSEPDLLHYDINHRYLVQRPAHGAGGHHGRRRRSKTPTRLVVALYDYSPRHMSPNPNGHFDELPFRKGQLITVLGDKDADGFYRGELDGRVGLVPGNLVVEVEGGVQALLNSPPTSTALIDYEAQTYGGGTGGGRYREAGGRSGAAAAAVAAARGDRSYYGARGGYGEGGIWDGRNGGSDPLLSRSHQRHAAAREQQLAAQAAAAGSFDNAYDRYSDSQDRYGTSGGSGGQARHRRSKYKQKSHSLEYDLDRRDYYDQEGLPYDRQEFQGQPPHGRGGAGAGEYGAGPDYDASSRLAARSLDRFHYQRQQPTIPVRGADPYGTAERSERSERSLPRRPAAAQTLDRVSSSGRRGEQQMWPPGYREGGGMSDQDSESELLHYQRQQQQQQQRKQTGQPRRMSMFDQQQRQQQQQQQAASGQGDFYGDQQEGWRNEDPSAQQQFASSSSRQQRAAPSSGYDRNGAPIEESVRRGSRAYPGGEEQLLAESRKIQQQQQQPPPDLFYDSPSEAKEGRERRRGSLRRGGRQKIEQNIRETVMGGGARRMIAKFDYDPKIRSPNPGAESEELSFRAGEFILVYGEMDDDGFYVGELGGRRGLVPSNYLAREQDMGMAQMGSSAQLVQQGMQQQQQQPSQHAMYEAQAAAAQAAAAAAAASGSGRSKKENLVSFAPNMVGGGSDMSTPIGGQLSSAPGPSGVEKKVPSQAGKPPSSAGASSSGQQKAASSSSGGGGGGTSGGGAKQRPPGQLKKADSTVGQKVPQKKTSTASGPTPGRKASTAQSSGKSGGGGGSGGGLWKKIVE